LGDIASDPVLDNMINTLISPVREITDPIPLKTYLGNEVHKVSETRGALGASTSTGDPIGVDLAWSRGLRLELSPIKTRSARKRLGTNLSFSHNFWIHL
jgi:hypothetical protein